MLIKNSTLSIPLLSVANASMNTSPLTVCPDAGSIITTFGCILSSSILSTHTLTEVRTVLLFQPSTRITWMVCSPSLSSKVFHSYEPVQLGPLQSIVPFRSPSI